MEIEEERRRFYDTKTFVYWDIEDYPLPEGYTVDSFYENVKSSIKNQGYGDVRILAYGDRKHSSRSVHVESLHPKIPLFRLGCRYGRHTNILLSMLSNARMDVLRPRTKLNFMLIIKDMPEEDETEVVSIVRFLRRRHYDVFLVVADEDDHDQSEVPLWRWKSLLNGGGPISPVTSEEDDDDTSDDEGRSRKRYKGN
ncbi:unnamed protein product [Arabis nemorensis]|uniref:NYN domain-containing protein n=1 Tax=Arabis nemorensis TaxID=586526 RepID=A0A565C2J7_9BRAS|nr:unnamed protein product [Arabis nemorensis]